jgi:hypothetical protein
MTGIEWRRHGPEPLMFGLSVVYVGLLTVVIIAFLGGEL